MEQMGTTLIRCFLYPYLRVRYHFLSRKRRFTQGMQVCFPLEYLHFKNQIVMRKILSLFLLTTLLFSPISAQLRVQGQPYPSAKQNRSEKEPNLRSDQNFTFDDVKFWVGTGSNQAALVIEWHDSQSPDALVWGYRWDGNATGHDMLVAIAKADPRLILLTQYTGWMGYTIDGLGYGEGPFDIRYDLEGAKNEPHNAFRFEPPITNPMLGQTGFPEDPAGDVAQAIAEAGRTGVIFHPINAQLYGYPSYDYDHWSCASGAIHWKSGWYYGYWSYYCKDDQKGTFSYSGVGASTRQLVNGSWDAWNWHGDMSDHSNTPLSDHFVAAPLPPGGSGSPDGSDDPEVMVTGVSLTPSSLRLQVGRTAKLAVKLTPVNADNQAVRWESSDPDVAPVANGIVTGHKPGTARITVTTYSGNRKAYADVTVVEAVVPGLTFNGSNAILSFPRTPEATSYEIRLYKQTGSEQMLATTYVTDSDGRIINRIDGKTLRAAADQLAVTLTDLEPNTAYRIEIKVMKDLEILDTYYTYTESVPTANETISAPGARAYYAGQTLYLEHMAGYRVHLFTLLGEVKQTFDVSDAAESHLLMLPDGIYLVAGEKEGRKISFKIQIGH